MHAVCVVSDSTSSPFRKGLAGVHKAGDEVQEAVGQGARSLLSALRL